ncbi:MAG: hypothetical protein JKY70_10975 [Mucilaginibacter sp.]|nr:hypothetical protein [Mucilaginibacter sp.]
MISNMAFWALLISIISLGWHVWKELFSVKRTKLFLYSRRVKNNTGNNSLTAMVRIEITNAGNFDVIIQKVKLISIASGESYEFEQLNDAFSGKLITPKSNLTGDIPAGFLSGNSGYKFALKTTTGKVFTHHIYSTD